MLIERMPVSAIAIDHRARSLDLAMVDELVTSIRRLGLQIPITVRIVSERMDDDDGVLYHEVPVLVAGRHRLEAARVLGWEDIPVVVSEGTETEAKMWEIAENLHRADLTVLERSEHIAEWIGLSDKKDEEAVLTRVASKPKGGRPEGGVRAASRDLGIELTEAQRAVKINGISDEAKKAAKDAGLDDKQSALLQVAAQPSAEAQLKAIKQKKDHDEAQKRNRDANRAIGLTAAEDFAERLFDRFAGHELPAIISLVECSKPKHVAAALRRMAA
jgi:ParB family transcriptional regulator, chromosome partitioning protein